MASHQLAIQSLDHAVKLVREEFARLPDGDAVAEKVLQKLQQTFDHPPTSDYEIIMHKNFTDDEVRCALFHPNVDQVWYYSAVFSVGLSLPSDHKYRKLLSLHLTLIYLIHR